MVASAERFHCILYMCPDQPVPCAGAMIIGYGGTWTTPPDTSSLFGLVQGMRSWLHANLANFLRSSFEQVVGAHWRGKKAAAVTPSVSCISSDMCTDLPLKAVLTLSRSTSHGGHPQTVPFGRWCESAQTTLKSDWNGTFTPSLVFT